MLVVQILQVSDLPKIAAMIQSLEPMERSNAVSKLRRLLSLGTRLLGILGRRIKV